MSPSNFVQHGGNADDTKDANQADSASERVAAAGRLLGAPVRGHLGPAPAAGADSSLINSILAQEEQRRRALLLSAGALYYPGTGGLSVADQAMALLVAERQRALLFGGGGFGGGAAGFGNDLFSMDSLGLSSSFGGRLGGLGGLGPTAFGGTGVTSAGALLGGQQHSFLGGSSGGTSTLGITQNPYSLLAAERGQSTSSSALAQPIANDQLLLDAMEQGGGRKGRTGTFPQKLHQMLSDLEKEEGGTEIASYLPHGRAFVIHNASEFVNTTMPKYFRMSRFSSFQRQLNLYEFMRITDGPDKGAYFHELFHRGRPVLASQIRRNKIKGATNMNASGANQMKNDSR